MKKQFSVVVVLTVICVLWGCSSIDYPRPHIDRPSAYVIDTYLVKGGFEDYVRLVNQTSQTDIAFKIYLHDPKKFNWIEYGTGNLKGPDDSITVKSGLSGNLDRYRYFAIEALDGNNYKYDFKKSRNDLYIYITLGPMGSTGGQVLRESVIEQVPVEYPGEQVPKETTTRQPPRDINAPRR